MSDRSFLVFHKHDGMFQKHKKANDSFPCYLSYSLLPAQNNLGVRLYDFFFAYKCVTKSQKKSVPDVCVWQVADLPGSQTSPYVGDNWQRKTSVQPKQQTVGRL